VVWRTNFWIKPCFKLWVISQRTLIWRFLFIIGLPFVWLFWPLSIPLGTINLANRSRLEVANRRFFLLDFLEWAKLIESNWIKFQPFLKVYRQYSVDRFGASRREERTMQSQQVVWSPVLNFVYHAWPVGMFMPILGKLVWTFLVYALIEANAKMWNFANSTNCSSDQKKLHITI